MVEAEHEAALEVRGLNHYYGTGDVRTQILHGLDLTIGAGELVIMTGPSGCGKTTLLTLIGGLRRVQEGNLRVLGREMRGLDDRQLVAVRRDIGFIFQAHNLFESLTAMRNVRMALELNAITPVEARRRAEQALRDVGLDGKMHLKPRALSGGQRQRVAVARALVNRPRLILADEPTAALDSKATDLVIGQMQYMTKELGCTILIVTHDVKILNRADRIVAMAEGRIKSNRSVAESIRLCLGLSRCPAFSRLSPEALANLSGKMVEEAHPVGARVIRQGDAGDKFYIIKQGRAEVVRDNGTGPERVAVLGEGDYFGETALLEGRPRNATIIALRDDSDASGDELRLYSLDEPSFRAAIGATASFEEQIIRIFSQRQ